MATLAKPELVVQELSPLHLIQQLLESGKEGAVEAIERLAKLQVEMERFAWEREERQSRIDFDEAHNRCQKAIGRIAPNQNRADTHSKWADYSQLDRYIRPIYTNEGFSVSYSEVEPVQVGKVRIKATLSRSGISKEYFHEITPSTTGAKGNALVNATDADAIAMARAKRYLLLDMFNIAVGIDSAEKAGVAPSDVKPMDEGVLMDWVGKIEESSTVEELKTNFFAAMKVAKDAADPNARKAFEQTKIRVWKQKGFHA